MEGIWSVIMGCQFDITAEGLTQICGHPVSAMVEDERGCRMGVCQKHLMEVDRANLAVGYHRPHCPCAPCTLARLPVINDPLIHEVLADLETEQNSPVLQQGEGASIDSPEATPGGD